MRQSGSFVLSIYAFRDGRTLAFHLEVEFRQMDSSAWSINGFLKRSVTAEAKLSSSSLGRDRVGMISSWTALFIKP